MSTPFWKAVSELAAMREHIPPERRALSGMVRLREEWDREFDDERIHVEERGDFTVVTRGRSRWSFNNTREPTYAERVLFERLRAEYERQR